MSWKYIIDEEDNVIGIERHKNPNYNGPEPGDIFKDGMTDLKGRPVAKLVNNVLVRNNYSDPPEQQIPEWLIETVAQVFEGIRDGSVRTVADMKTIIDDVAGAE